MTIQAEEYPLTEWVFNAEIDLKSSRSVYCMLNSTAISGVDGAMAVTATAKRADTPEAPIICGIRCKLTEMVID